MQFPGNQLRQVLRRLVYSPLFTTVALLTLAVSIGANAAIFAVVDGILIKPLPYPNPQSLVGVWLSAPALNLPVLNIGFADYFTISDENQTFEHFGMWDTGAASITGEGQPEEIQTLNVTGGALEALGIQPAMGRWFLPDDYNPDAPETAILTWPYWQRKFGGNPNVVGTRLITSAEVREIIGVMPQHFQFLDYNNIDLILPYDVDRSKTFLGNFSYQGLARLKAGVTLDQANADLGRIIPIVATKFPPPPGFNLKLFEEVKLLPNVRPLERDVTGEIGNVLWILMGTIGIVLLIACANVANLLLVRAEGRQQEFAIRASLGAGWHRIAGDVLAESIVLAFLGGLFGILLAYGGVQLLVAIGPESLPRLGNIAVDVRVVLFTVGISLVTAVLFAVLPVLKYATPHLSAGLRGGGRTSSHSRERHRARNTLVVVQISLALVLLVGSGLMIRTFLALKDVRPGFARPEEVQTLRIIIPEREVENPERTVRMQQDILERIRALPGVTSAAMANSAPLDGNNSTDVLFAEDRNYREGELPPLRRFRFVAPGHFETLGNPVIAGRDVEWADLYQLRQVAIISENMAREMWQAPDRAIGKRIRESNSAPWREIIGVVGDVYYDGVDKPAPTTVYWPMLMSNFWGNETYVARGVVYAIRSSRTGAAGFLDEIQRSAWEVNPNLPLAAVRSLDDLYRRSTARTSFTLTMLGISSAMAVFLGIVGIYGVMAYVVSQRTREVGIRMALGARHGHVQAMFVQYGLLLAVAGTLLGLVAAAALSHLMASLLFKVSPLDPMTYVAVSLGLAAAAIIASYIPARKATRVNPTEALRAE